jgi:hypothetical protein
LKKKGGMKLGPLPKGEEEDMNQSDIYFQQDSATAHNADSTDCFQ